MIETPFNYTGSKFKLLDQLIPIFDKTKARFVDMFAGGGSVYTNVASYYPQILVNDIIADLMGIHKKLIFETDETVLRVKSLTVSKDDPEGYGALRNNYNESPTPEKLFALMLCCTNNMMRFNKKFKFNQTFGKRTFNPRTDQKIEAFSKELLPYREKITFSTNTFYDVVCGPDDFVYFDPPYSQTEAGYNSFWETDDDLGLFKYCENLDLIGSKFGVSGVKSHDGKSCRLIDLLLERGYHETPLDCNYDKVSRKGAKVTKEVLITNYVPRL